MMDDEPESRQPTDDAGTRRPGHSLATLPLVVQQQLRDAQTVGDAFHAAIELISRLADTVGIWIYYRNDRGMLTLTDRWQAPEQDLLTIDDAALTSLIHQRWIKAHRPQQSLRHFAHPFIPTDYPEKVVVPALLADELVGAIVVERGGGNARERYTVEDLLILTTVSVAVTQTVYAITLRQRIEELDEAQWEQGLVDQERRRIGHELHDGIVQDLAYLRLRLEMIERTLATDPTRARADMVEVRTQIDRSISDLRRMISDLRRGSTTARGVTGQLRDLAARFADTESKLEIDVAELSGIRLAPEVERAVVGIVREALQNVRKHSEATSVRVEVQREHEDLHVIVQDDGIGMCGDDLQDQEAHFGMDQMRELAEETGGSLQVESGMASGTCVHARIPLAPLQRDR